MGSEENIRYPVVFLWGEMGVGSQFLFLTWHTGLVLNSFFQWCRKIQLSSVRLRTASLPQDSDPKPPGASRTLKAPPYPMSDRGMKSCPPRRYSGLCPSLGDFNKVTESSEIGSECIVRPSCFAPSQFFKGFLPVILNDIWGVPLYEKMWLLSLPYIYIISLRKSLQFKLSQFKKKILSLVEERFSPKGTGNKYGVQTHFEKLRL